MIASTQLPARDRAQLVVSNVSVSRGGLPVLVDADLTIAPGARLGVVGENGRGKSTLLHIMAGMLSPDQGTVSTIGTLAIAEQEMSSSDGRTIGEVINEQISASLDALAALDSSTEALAKDELGSADRYAAALDRAQALNAWDADRRIDIALARLAAASDRTQRLSELSVGQRYRVRLACLLGSEVDFLLLDEPTNHLDDDGLEFLTTTLRNHPGGVVVVSHDRALLSDVATTIVDLDTSRDGRPRIYGGGFAAYRQAREAELVRWEAEYEQQCAALSKLTQDLSEAQNRLSTGWKPDKGVGKYKRQSRAPGIVRSVNRRRADVDRLAIVSPIPPQRFRMPDLPAQQGIKLLNVDQVTLEGRLHEPVSMILESEDKIVVTGPNGAGKTSLLSILAGTANPSRGTVKKARNIRIGLLSQESKRTLTGRAADVFAAHVGQLGTFDEADELDELSLSQLGILSSSDSTKSVGELSMGQQRRLDLAMVLATRPHVLLLDEPTNHLSIALVDELTEALKITKAAVILATHDRQLQRETDQWPRLRLNGIASSVSIEATAQ